MKHKLLAFIFLGILLLPIISAVCTLTFDKTDYSPTEDITAGIICDNYNERNDAYTLNWTNSTGGFLKQM